ncbi:MAG: hypothetical protein WBQ95_15290 [Terracidiphilus sp.]
MLENVDEANWEEQLGGDVGVEQANYFLRECALEALQSGQI